jgi:RNA polymerase sigma-70 factor, ECF subfamily
LTDSSEYNEKELLKQAKEGDLKAYNKLVQQHMNQVYATALKMTRHKEDAEDVVQQTFVAVVKHLHSFRGESAFSTWILRIAINNTLKLLKKKKRRYHVSPNANDTEESWDSISLENETPPTWNQNPEDLLKNEEFKSRIHKSLEHLDPKHRPVFVLRDMEGLSTKEVAQALEISESNVKIRLMRARLVIRKFLNEF